MQKLWLQGALPKMITTLAFGHMFCCGLPIVFSVLSLVSGVGLTLPHVFEELHHVMHDFELTILVISLVLTAVGWGFYLYGRRVDCHDTGCDHGPCDERKAGSAKMLIFASILVGLNLLHMLIA